MIISIQTFCQCLAENSVAPKTGFQITCGWIFPVFPGSRWVGCSKNNRLSDNILVRADWGMIFPNICFCKNFILIFF